MHYLEKGMVNSYSTKFPYRVGTNISHLIFSWNTSETKRPVKYAINAVADKFDVLPVVNLPPQGVIPKETESGFEFSEVKIVILQLFRFCCGVQMCRQQIR